MPRRLALIGIAGLGVATGVYSLRVAQDNPSNSFAGASAGGAAALLGAGWALIGGGLVFWARRPGNRFGVLLAAAGFAWFVLEWINPSIGSAAAFTIGLCLYAACAPLVGHALLAYPGGKLSSWIERGAVAAAYGGGGALLGVVPALLSSPASAGCNECPRNLAVLADRPTLADDLTRVGLYLGVGWALVLTLLVVISFVRASETARRTGWPPAAAGTAYLVLVAATFAASLDRGFLWNGTFERRLWLAEAAALVGVATGVSWSLLRGRRARSTVARLVVELAESAPPGGLRDVLAEIVGDPELVLAYPLDGSDRLVDAAGRPVELSALRAQTRLVRDGRPVAVLAHAPGLLDDEQLVDDVTTAARLALENERLQAEVRARLEELRASRARIVATSDAERRRLEHNLHDGAQQRLVTLALSLRLLRSQHAPNSAAHLAEQLEDAETELDRAISELRDLAHGIFPAVLADGGLAVAVRALAEEGRVPIATRDLPEGRLSAAVETTAYTIVAEAARTATSGVLVHLTRRGNVLAVEVETDDDPALDLVALENRVGALDGRLRYIHGENRRVTIRAELPCGS